MIQTSARLLQLLSLLQVRREWTGPALADRMGVTERTVRRDIDKLRNLGYPIHASPGIAGGYQLGAGAQLPPLLLDDNEALAVALGLSSVPPARWQASARHPSAPWQSWSRSCRPGCARSSPC
nr:HTH domain-containing protein [Paenarthrobacter aurescens]